jgi:demethylspheroidene O-methyltransferase
MSLTQTDKSFFRSFFSKKELPSLLAVRNKILSNPAFQAWAARFPLTRFVARRRARVLFDLCAGFVYSQVLLAAVRLRLCEILLEGPQTLERLAVRLNLPREGAHRLLEAAVALRLAQRCGQARYGAGDLGAALVGNPGVAAMVEHHGMLYADLRDPIALLRGDMTGGTALGQHWPYAAADAKAELSNADVGAYSTLMSASQPLVAADVLGAYRFDRHRCLLDIGGGEGTFLRAVALAAPGLRLMLFDLPAVAGRARQRFAEAGMAERAAAFGGDFYRDALPTGADIISLVRVIHDHDDEAAMTILRAARQALPPGGTLLLAEPMAGTPGAEPVGAYFGFYLMAMGSGRPRRVEELTGMLQQAGFGAIRRLRTNQPLLVRVLIARAAT